jgi:methyltransferase (TIGR00027 family)
MNEPRQNQTDRSAIRNISDTALWAAVYRARENEARNPLFRDPFARRLVGTRGDEIASSMPSSDQNTWAWITRTYLFDQFIIEQVRAGVDMIVNLAAGLDARPYRMALPASLQWVEVDLPGILEYKEKLLASEKPFCALERVRLDLADVNARRALFAKLGEKAASVLVITEGLIIYFTAEEVSALARDLATPPAFKHWLLDLASPGLVRLLQKHLGQKLSEGGAKLQFGPLEGSGFFAPFGWHAADVRGMLKTAVRLHRGPWWGRLATILPESKGAQGNRPWSGVCLLEKHAS